MMARAFTCPPISSPFSGVHLAGKPNPGLRRRWSCAKWVVRAEVERKLQEKSRVDVEAMVRFLYDDLPNVFDEKGIDRRVYDDNIKFSDPVTKYDNIDGYLRNIATLKALFNPDLQLHWVKQTGAYEITTRWSVVMRYVLLPWRPEFVLTGISVMDIDPHTGKFCSHQDYWDSVENNDYFSVEGLLDVLKQLMYKMSTDLESPKYRILKRTPHYEIRKYSPLTTKTKGDLSFGSTKFNSIITSSPVLKDKNVKLLREMEGGGVAGVLKFGGNPTHDLVVDKATSLKRSLLKDGLKPRYGFMLAPHDRESECFASLTFFMENEVLIWLDEFSLD